MTEYLKDLPDFKKYSGYSSKAHSPPRPEYENMTPPELEEVLGVKITRDPSLIGRAKSIAKSMFGMKTLPQYDDREVRIARLMAQSTLDRIKKKNEKHKEDLAMSREIENYNEAAKIQQKERQRRQYAAEAARSREQLPNLITDQHIRDAKRKYQDLRVAADKSATTDAFVPYDVISTQRDGAQQDLEALEARLAAQPQKAHDRLVNAFLNQIDRGKMHRGGKSKRVKSKRNKRTKRRNARK